MQCDRRKHRMPTVAAGPERPPSRAGARRVVSAVVVVVLLAVGGFGFVVTYAAFTLPNIDRLGAATGSLRILDRHGALIADVGLGATPHDTVSLDHVAPMMQAAIIAAEDRQFYTEGSINPGRI